MTSGLFYFAANIVALTATLVIGGGVLVSKPRSFDARLFAAVMLSSACYLVGRLSYAVPAEVRVSTAAWPFLLVLMNMGTGLWMVLAHSLFQDARRIPRWMIAAFAVQLLLSAVNAFAYVGSDSSAMASARNPMVRFAFGPVPLAMQSLFALIALYWAIRGWRADLDEGRRVLRALFLILVGGLLFGINLAEFLLIDARPGARAPFDNTITLAMAAGYGAVALVILRFDDRVLERLTERALHRHPAIADDQSAHDLAALMQALEVERIYLAPGLTIGSLAKRLEVPEYRLRALINKRLGYRNFNALLHDYRLRNACADLADRQKAHLPILTIALDVGYQSITPFNQAFREAMGCTPSSYRRRFADSA